MAAQAMGMNKVIREDALRRALERIDEAGRAAWTRPALTRPVREALDRPWVPDIDTTLNLTPLQGKANIHTALQHVKAAAEQLKAADRWALLLRYIRNEIVPTLGPFRPPNVLPATGNWQIQGERFA